MNNEYGKPDKEEKCIRFGCGSIFGLALGCGICLNNLSRHLLFTNNIVIISIIITITLLCGYLAMKNGDKFWYTKKPWWWPF